MVKNLPAMQETRLRSLGREDSLEEEIATHSSMLAWRIPWTEEPGGLQPMGHRVRYDRSELTAQGEAYQLVIPTSRPPQYQLLVTQ